MHLLLPGGLVNPGEWAKGLHLIDRESISSVTLEVRYFSAQSEGQQQLPRGPGWVEVLLGE